MRTLAILLLLGGCSSSQSTAVDGALAGRDSALTGSDAALADAPAVPSLDTPAGTWTWVEVPGTACANGVVEGIGVNRSTTSDDLFVYFEGGGACWDGETCFVEDTAINMTTTYDATQFAADEGGAPLDRGSGSPFADATFVWVPYCTGDVHAGDHVATYDNGSGAPTAVHHVGGANTQLDIAALRASFPNAAHVWVVGSSAGGYGATLNFDRFVTAWPSASFELLQDSAPFVPVLANFATWQTSWEPHYPPACLDCTTSFPRVIDALATEYPTSRIGLLTYDDDATISAYFGYTSSLVPATDALVSTEYAYSNTKAFVLAGTSHTMLGEVGSLVGPDGVTLVDWITEWATGSAAWATTQP